MFQLTFEQDFLLFMVRLCLLNQIESLSILVCNSLITPSRESDATSIIVSSTNKVILGSHIGRSFMNNKNNVGPKIEPWGIPILTCLKSD